MNEQLKPFLQVLVRDGDNEQWRIDFFEQYQTDTLHPYVTMCGIYDRCIPYEGNEELLGTTDSPKPKRWRAEIDEEYWYVAVNGVALKNSEFNNVLDNQCYSIGNYFRTEEEAQAMADRFRAMLKGE